MHQISHLANRKKRKEKAIDSFLLTNGENTVPIQEEKESRDSGL